MPPKKRPPVKAAKAAKLRMVAPKEKPTSMSQEACADEKRRCAIMTADRKRCHVAAEAHKGEAARAAAAVEVCLSLGGSPSSPGYFAKASPLSHMLLSQMDGRARYFPEYAESDTFDANATFSPDSAPRGSGTFRFPVDLNASPDLPYRVPGRNAVHVTDNTSLPSASSAATSRAPPGVRQHV
jgi:hypothetical protein